MPALTAAPVWYTEVSDFTSILPLEEISSAPSATATIDEVSIFCIIKLAPIAVLEFCPSVAVFAIVPAIPTTSVILLEDIFISPFAAVILAPLSTKTLLELFISVHATFPVMVAVSTAPLAVAELYIFP